MSAHSTAPNAKPSGQDFEHNGELGELVRVGHLFKFVDEESDVYFLVRVDLGDTISAGALNRAADVVNTILDVLNHNSGGARPHLAQHAIMRSGRATGTAGEPAGFTADKYGAEINARAIEEHGLPLPSSQVPGTPASWRRRASAADPERSGRGNWLGPDVAQA